MQKRFETLVFILILLLSAPLSSFAEENKPHVNPPGPKGGPGAGPQFHGGGPADRNHDGQVGPVERHQARPKVRERFGDKAFNSTGQSTGKPAWMDNNPLKPASDSEGAPAFQHPGQGNPPPGMHNNPPGMQGGPGTDWRPQQGNNPPGHQGGGPGFGGNPPGPRGGPGFGNPPGQPGHERRPKN